MSGTWAEGEDEGGISGDGGGKGIERSGTEHLINTGPKTLVALPKASRAEGDGRRLPESAATPAWEPAPPSVLFPGPRAPLGNAEGDRACPWIHTPAALPFLRNLYEWRRPLDSRTGPRRTPRRSQ